MKQALRRETIRHLLPRIITFAVLCVLCFGIGAQGLFYLVRGPKELSEISPDSLEGNYVSFDASEVIVAFATLSTSSDSDSDSDSVTLKTYYLLPAGDGTYLAVMDKKEKNATVLDKAMDQSYEYYMGDLTELTSLGTISGYATALDDDMTDYMVDCIENYSLPGYEEGADTSALIRPVQINLEKVGYLSKTWALILGGAALLFLILTLVFLIPALTGHYQKKALAVMRKDHSQEELETLFAASERIENVWVGAYILYQKGATSHVIPVESLIWGYAMPEPLVVSKYRWPVALYNREQAMTRLAFMEKKDCQKFLDAISAQGHPFLSGYTSDYSQKFQSDFEGFTAMVESQAIKG